MNNEIIGNNNNPVKQEIMTTYIKLNGVAANLRNIVMSNAPGNKNVVFREFRNDMFYLYELSHRFFLSFHMGERELPVCRKFKKWNSIQRTSFKQSFILDSLDLYEEYADELVKHNIIMMGE